MIITVTKIADEAMFLSDTFFQSLLELKYSRFQYYYKDTSFYIIN